MRGFEQRQIARGRAKGGRNRQLTAPERWNRLACVGARIRLYNPMPFVLKPDAWPLWLGERSAEATQLIAAGALPLRRHGLPAGQPARWQRANNDPKVIEPVAAG